MTSYSVLDTSLVNSAAPPGSMRYFSLLYTPPERRDAIMALYVIDAEIRESARGANHDVAHTRLQWWRAEVERLVNGNPQHPATRTLNDRAAHDRAVFSKLHEIMVAADMDLARMTFANPQELRAYCSRSGGAVQELVAAQLVSPDSLDEASRAAANKLGIGIRQSEMLRDLRRDAYDGHVYLPLDLLDKHGVKPEELRARELESRVKELLKSFRHTVQAELEPPARGSTSARLRSLFVLAALHRRLLDRIAARNYEVGAERIELGPIEKPWIAWRAARRNG